VSQGKNTAFSKLEGILEKSRGKKGFTTSIQITRFPDLAFEETNPSTRRESVGPMGGKGSTSSALRVDQDMKLLKGAASFLWKLFSGI